MKKISIFFGILLLVSCYQQERNCTNFRNGKIKYEHEIEGKKKVTYYERKDSLEIENYEGKIDSSYVRWINDCEYILHKINPKNRHEQKGVHIKILTTTNNSYKFEFNLVGDSNKQQGTVIKLE